MSRRPLPFDGKLDRSIVLVGLMGAGKSTVGRRLARRLGLPFVDSDTEIEDAAGLSAGEVFQRFGERDFRDGERRVVARLAEGPVRVIATGGGAFVNDGTRALLNAKCITVWLDAPVRLLTERTARRPETRPMLTNGSRAETLARLDAERRPAYSEAHIRVTSDGSAHGEVVERIVAAIDQHLGEKT
ncbi:shikimate kinase [Sphingomonas kaistensis]|uniref:Shikimate kinase n=1 Tax=Sphingomonas kaistensis TaxID=298708 RepID=A0A7X6BGP8_9SPHN|nr:shikimate kinase [Sphingomonas kaistensis]NJC06669.1 shikimate kinase [Sphingomonas kaistensis]